MYWLPNILRSIDDSDAIPRSRHDLSRRNDADIAFTASARDVANLDSLIKLTNSKAPLNRYWATQGLLILGQASAPAEKALITLTTDAVPSIRVAAAQTLFVIGKKEQGRDLLLNELLKGGSEYNQQNAINALRSIHALDKIPSSWIKKTLADPKAGKYVRRLAVQLSKN